MERRRVRLIISGFVQGVGFRAFIRREATKRELAGWVGNTADGKVEAVLEGPKATVGEMVALCQRGPILSMVREVKVFPFKGEEKLTGFEIKK